MSPALRESIYRSVERAVLWGESREKVFKILEVNGLVGSEAEELYARARAERISVLRGEGMRRAIRGFMVWTLALSLFLWFWHDLGFITGRVLMLTSVGFLVGFWWFFDGLLRMLFAPTRTGSVVGVED